MSLIRCRCRVKFTHVNQVVDPLSWFGRRPRAIAIQFSLSFSQLELNLFLQTWQRSLNKHTHIFLYQEGLLPTQFEGSLPQYDEQVRA